MMNYEQHGDAALLHFDDGKANAVSHHYVDAMNEGLDRAEKDASSVILYGMSGKFSAGFDLSEFNKGPVEMDALSKKGAEMLLRIFSHPQPVIAACTGHAMAAGALILLACDTRVGLQGNFKIGLNETAIGLQMPVFGLELAGARLSKRHLTQALVQARLYEPETAVEAGFLDLVVEEEELQKTVVDMAQQLGQLPGKAYARNKLGSRAVYIERIRKSLDTND